MPVISKEEFKDLLRSKPRPLTVCNDHLFNSEVWLFERSGGEPSPALNDRMRAFFAEKLSVSVANVCLVGSAKLGFSLSPTKGFRDFDDETSDLDVVIVSGTLYKALWDGYYERHYSGAGRVREYIARSVFLRYITVSDTEMTDTPAIAEWQRKIATFRTDFYTEFLISNPIKYRVYESWEAVEAYHADGIETLMGMV